MREDSEQRYWSLRHKALEDYYREAEGLDAKQIRESIKGDYDQFQNG